MKRAEHIRTGEPSTSALENQTHQKLSAPPQRRPYRARRRLRPPAPRPRRKTRRRPRPPPRPLRQGRAGGEAGYGEGPWAGKEGAAASRAGLRRHGEGLGRRARLPVGQGCTTCLPRRAPQENLMPPCWLPCTHHPTRTHRSSRGCARRPRRRLGTGRRLQGRGRGGAGRRLKAGAARKGWAWAAAKVGQPGRAPHKSCQ